MQISQKKIPSQKKSQEKFQKLLNTSVVKLKALGLPDISLLTTNVTTQPAWEFLQHTKFSDTIHTIIAMKLSEDVPGSCVLSFVEKDAAVLAKSILDAHNISIGKNDTDSEELLLSVLKEFTNILFGVLFSELFEGNVNIGSTIPDLTNDIAKATLDELFSELAMYSPKTTVLEAKILINPLDVKCNLFLILSNMAFEKFVVKSLYGDSNE